jgi:phosphoglycerol transferase
MNKIYTWREDILKFWNFPKLPKKIIFNSTKTKIFLENNEYNSPILLKVQSNNMLPFFQEGVPKKLFEQFGLLKNGDNYIYIDKCKILTTLLSKKNIGLANDNLCIVQGKFGQNFKLQEIDNEEYSLEDFNNFSSPKNNINKIKNNIKKLKKLGIVYPATLSEGIVFKRDGYPDFLDNIEGISNKEKWGRWSDARLNPTVVFKFNNKLPKNFILELEVGAYGPNINRNVKVKIGDKIEEFKIINANPRKYTLKFMDINSSTIEIIPPKPTSPASINQSGDERKLGLSFVKLSIRKF